MQLLLGKMNLYFRIPNSMFGTNSDKNYVLESSAAVFLFGFFELVTSSAVIFSSSGFYVGGIYCGVVCVILGAGEVSIIRDKTFLQNREKFLRMFQISSFICILISMVAFFLQLKDLMFLKSLKACSTDSGGTCTCTNSVGISYDFKNVTTCSNILTVLPKEICVSFVIALTCFIACGFNSSFNRRAHWKLTHAGLHEELSDSSFPDNDFHHSMISSQPTTDYSSVPSSVPFN